MRPRPQSVAIWPASAKEVLSYRQTPYMLMTGAGWIARAAWWVLKKQGALTPFVETIRTWTFEPAAQKPLYDAMIEAAGSDLPHVVSGNAVFIIGSKNFQDLATAPAFKRVLTFESGPFAINDPYYGRRVFNIPIHVVPNMVGFALVPKVLIEERQS